MFNYKASLVNLELLYKIFCLGVSWGETSETLVVSKFLDGFLDSSDRP